MRDGSTTREESDFVANRRHSDLGFTKGLTSEGEDLNVTGLTAHSQTGETQNRVLVVLVWGRKSLFTKNISTFILAVNWPKGMQ